MDEKTLDGGTGYASRSVAGSVDGGTGYGARSDFEERRKHLSGLSDTQLKKKFWELAREIMEPLAELAFSHTSPAIERSVVLRMGFSSLEAQAIVSAAEKRGWLGRGVGRVILEYATAKGTGYLEAGRELAAGEGWDVLAEMLGGGDR